MSVQQAIDRLIELGRDDLAASVSDLVAASARLAVERAEFRMEAERERQRAAALEAELKALRCIPDEFDDWYAGSNACNQIAHDAARMGWEAGYSRGWNDAAEAAPVAASAEVPADAPQSFVDYMKDNYPAGCRIQSAEWHAPKIWRAARRAMLAAAQQEKK